MVELTSRSVGVFRGFSESGLEFKAEIIAPYKTDYNPLLGSFLLVDVTPESSVLGRITKFYPSGTMSTYEGEDYLARLTRMQEEVPEDLKESKLRYNVSVKLLGLVSTGDGSFRF